MQHIISYHKRTMGLLVSNSRWRWLVASLGLFGLLVLGLYHQPYYPQTWLDEGFVLQGAMNLAHSGVYGMKSVEGIRILDQPLIANGPGVVLPIAAAFYIFGVGLLQARLVMVVFLVLTAVMYFVVARRLYGRVAAFVSIFLLLAVPAEGFILYGRHALGNVPALAYFLLGYWLWLIALERDDYLTPLGVGLLLGLATVTKGQYLLMLPVWLTLFAADYFYFKQIGSKKLTAVLIGLMICLTVWYAAQIFLVGWANVGLHFGRIGSSSAVTVTAFKLIRTPGNIWYLFRSGFVLFVLPGFMYVGWSCRQRNQATARQLFLIIFIAIWLVWYVFASVGWPRYTFEPFVIGLLFTGKAVADSLQYLQNQRGLGDFREIIIGNHWHFRKSLEAFSVRMNDLISEKALFGGRSLNLLKNLLLALFVGTICVGGIWGLSRQVKAILAEPNRTPQLFASYLQTNIPAQAVVESWEWEIDALTTLTYHHPTNDWVDRMTAVLQFNAPSEASYDPFTHNPDYLIDGPFSKWTELYRSHLAGNCCTLIKQIGPYDLYAVNLLPP